MGAARRFRHDLVGQPQAHEVLGGHGQRRGHLARLGRVLEQDRRARLGRDDRVVRVLEHDEPVAEADGERASTAAFADPHAHDRDRQGRQGRQALGDGPGHAALLRLEARESALRVEERHEREAEAAGEPHDAVCLAESLGLRHPEVALDVLLGSLALAMAEHRHAPSLDRGEAGEHRLVIAELAVAAKLEHVGEQRLHVVLCLGTVGMARDLHALPGGQRAVQRVAKLLDLYLEGVDLRSQLGLLRDVEPPQRPELVLEFRDRPLELHHERAGHVTHRPRSGSPTAATRARAARGGRRPRR